MPSPQQAELQRGQAFFFADPPNHDLAAECFRRVTDDAPKWAEGYVWLGHALTELGQADAATQAYERAVELDASDDRPVISLGVLLLRGGKPKDAIPWLERGVAMRPHYTEADTRMLLAEALEATGQLREAIVQWKTVVGMEPGYPSGDEPMRNARQKLKEHGVEAG
jgi:cytochrome c-type biogenesis protein CcmH/NrfG